MVQAKHFERSVVFCTKIPQARLTHRGIMEQEYHCGTDFVRYLIEWRNILSVPKIPYPIIRCGNLKNFSFNKIVQSNEHL